MIAQFASVWSAVADVIYDTFPKVTALFYAEGNLTFIGTMAVVMAGIALVLLVFNIIRSFFALRG